MHKILLSLNLLLLASCDALYRSESYSVKGCPKLSAEDLEKFNGQVAEIKKKASHQMTIEHKFSDGCETRIVKRSGS